MGLGAADVSESEDPADTETGRSGMVIDEETNAGSQLVGWRVVPGAFLSLDRR